MTSGMSIESVRAKADSLPDSERCQEGCPGWFVADYGYGLEIESCDECWDGVADPLLDDEAELLPEAQNELVLANTDEDAYIYPFRDRVCECGSRLWRPSSDGPKCVSCGHGI